MSDIAQEVVRSLVRDNHRDAWAFGSVCFAYADDDPPTPRGLLIGEAPGPNSDPEMPLFPMPGGSTSARLLRYAGITHRDWMGKLIKMNLCDGPWSERRAVAGRARVLAYLFDEENYHDGEPLRVLLLGVRVARAWDCYGAFGHERRVAWIPNPSGKNLIYNDRKNQLRARRAVLWAIGDRDSP